jgi:hypothetical protein
MYIIILIVISIITLEIYSSLSNVLSGGKIKNLKKIEIQKNNDQILFNEYNVKDDKKIRHRPGKLMIKNDYNLFINSESNNILLRKGYIYTVDTPFELEIVNMSEENILYYYIEDM